jgi:hypothetical protein
MSRLPAPLPPPPPPPPTHLHRLFPCRPPRRGHLVLPPLLVQGLRPRLRALLWGVVEACRVSASTHKFLHPPLHLNTYTRRPTFGSNDPAHAKCTASISAGAGGSCLKARSRWLNRTRLGPLLTAALPSLPSLPSPLLPLPLPPLLLPAPALPTVGCLSCWVGWV